MNRLPHAHALPARQFACSLGMVATFAGSQLDTWMATHGYCRPLNSSLALDERIAQCVPPESLYLQCLWWGVGMLMGAPISMTPDKGPYPRYYFDPDNEVNLRNSEQIIVIVLKFCSAFHWTTVIARFVFVFTNLDKDQKDFQLGWDALKKFVSFFKVQNTMAMQLRRARSTPRSLSTISTRALSVCSLNSRRLSRGRAEYYLERNTEVRARSRRKVLNQFSPKLAEEVVWELDKRWLVRVPCFSLVAERVSGDELRFFVQVALKMDVTVFVPSDRPEPRRLYIITQGVALYKGQQLGVGRSWGAEDVLLSDRRNSGRLRAYAMTYLHVQWLDAAILDGMKDEFPRAHLLCRFWTMMHAVGEFLLENLRHMRTKPVLLPVANLEERINSKQVRVELTGMANAQGEELYRVLGRYVAQGGYEIVRRGEAKRFFVHDVLGESPNQPTFSEAPGMALVRHGELYQVVDSAPMAARAHSPGPPVDALDSLAA